MENNTEENKVRAVRRMLTRSADILSSIPGDRIGLNMLSLVDDAKEHVTAARLTLDIYLDEYEPIPTDI
jgi:hypothetical protein